MLRINSNFNAISSSTKKWISVNTGSLSSHAQTLAASRIRLRDRPFKLQGRLWVFSLSASFNFPFLAVDFNGDITWVGALNKPNKSVFYMRYIGMIVYSKYYTSWLENDMFIDFSGVLGGTETVSFILFFVFALVNPSGFTFCCSLVLC